MKLHDWRLALGMYSEERTTHGLSPDASTWPRTTPWQAGPQRPVMAEPEETGPVFGEHVIFDPIKIHYYRSRASINPTGVVPAGPVIDFDEPHGRN